MQDMSKHSPQTGLYPEKPRPVRLAPPVKRNGPNALLQVALWSFPWSLAWTVIGTQSILPHTPSCLSAHYDNGFRVIAALHPDWIAYWPPFVAIMLGSMAGQLFATRLRPSSLCLALLVLTEAALTINIATAVNIACKDIPHPPTMYLFSRIPALLALGAWFNVTLGLIATRIILELVLPKRRDALRWLLASITLPCWLYLIAWLTQAGLEYATEGYVSSTPDVLTCHYHPFVTSILFSAAIMGFAGAPPESLEIKP